MDSLLKAGYMGTVLVMREASYLDAGDVERAVDRNVKINNNIHILS